MTKAMTFKPAAYETPAEHNFDIQELISELRRYSKLFLAIFAVVFVVVLAASVTQAPKYTSTSQVLISDDNSQPLPGQTQTTPDQPPDQATVESEVELVKSRTVAERVIDQLGLQNDPEFNPAKRHPTLFSKIKDFITLKPLREQWQRARTAGTPAQVTAKLERQNIVDTLEGDLGVNRVGLTRVIEISFTSGSKEKAAQIANAWAQQYIEQKFATAEAANQKQTNFLSARIDGLRAQVEQAQRAVQQYKIAHNLLSAEGATLTEQEISDLNRQLATARTDEAESQARLATVREQMAAGSHGDDVGETLNSTVIANLRTQAAQFSSKLADLQTKYGPLHPEVMKVKQQLRDINGQIDAEIKRIVSNLSAQNKIQQQRAGVLAASVARAQGQLAANSKADVQLQELELNAESVRALYESYLDRLKQTATGAGAQSANARVIVDAPIPLKPSSPKIALALLVAFAAGSLAGGGGVAVRRAFDSGLTVGNDIEQKLEITYLTSIPALKSTPGAEAVTLKPHEYLMQKRLSSFSESFRNLRVSLFHTGGARKAKVVAVTSALPGEGKTTTSACLAVSMAGASTKVILVDCDLRRQGVSDAFGLTPKKGLREVLNGQATLSDAIYTDGPAGLHILPLTPHSADDQDLFDMEALDRVLGDLRRRYDIVLLDTAPVLPVAETRVLAQKADVVALLVRWRHTPLKAAQRATDLLKEAGVNFAGAALTQVDLAAQTRYGYGDTEYYFNSYKTYYQA
jgi:capsular exopolysaccharide synthesis family protein